MNYCLNGVWSEPVSTKHFRVGVLILDQFSLLDQYIDRWGPGPRFTKHILRKNLQTILRIFGGPFLFLIHKKVSAIPQQCLNI